MLQRLALVLLVPLALMAQPQRAPQPPLALLKANIERITKSINAEWGIYIKCLETGEEISINDAHQMETMSVIKIPLMVEAFRQIEDGKFKLDDTVILKESDKRPGTGVIRSLGAGAVLTIKDLLTLMIIVSDNTATDLMFAKVGGIEPVNALMHQYGFETIRATAPSDTWFKALRAAPSAEVFYREAKNPFGLASPHELGLLLEKIERKEAVNAKASEMMLQMMRGQLYTTRLPKYLSGVRLPHKTGDFLPYVGNDVGILEMPGHNVVISVFTGHHFGVGTYLEDAIGRIGEQVANYFGYHQ